MSDSRQKESQTALEDLTIRPHQPEDDAPSVAIFNRLNPEYPPTTAKELRQMVERFPPGIDFDRRTAERNGQVVGISTAFKLFWFEHPGVYTIQIAVDPAHWAHGIGGRLYGWALGRVREWGAERVYAEVREDQPHCMDFASRRGFSQTGRTNRMSGLDVAAANLEEYEGLEERLRRDGIRIATLAELGRDDETLRGVYEVMESSAQDIPTSEVVGMPFETWRDSFLAMPGMSDRTSWVALVGDRPIGVAFFQRRGDHAGFNAYTGVDRTYRGKGVARALKLKTIEWARENGIDLIVTGNDIDNERMLAINRRLGYRPLPSSLEIVKEL